MSKKNRKKRENANYWDNLYIELSQDNLTEEDLDRIAGVESELEPDKHWRKLQEQSVKNKDRVKAKTPNQEKYYKAIETSTLTICTGPAGTGKAQPLHSLIRIPGGWKRMGDIKLGDTVSTPTGKTTKVTGIYPQGDKEIYRVNFVDGSYVECCDEHLWKIWNHQLGGYRIVPLSEIRRMLKLPSHKNRIYVPLIENSDIKEDIQLEIDPYMLGVLIGDGYAEASKEKCKVNHLKKYDHSIVAVEQPNSVAKKLKKLGLLGLKSHEKFIPERYLESSFSQKIKLLQGLLDTDGYIDKKGVASFCTTSKKLAEQVRYLIMSIGGVARISTKKTSYTHNGEKRAGKLAYQVNIRYKEAGRLFRLSRKKNRANESYQYKDCLRRKIVSVEKVGIMPAQCIAVEDEKHLYITNDFVVTHNTYLPCGIAAGMLQDERIDKIILVRPLVECGNGVNKLGALPGSLDEKVGPYTRALLDALGDFLSEREIFQYQKSKVIEIVPLELMRGLTLDYSFVILDEAQNATKAQLLMFLTRIGKGSRFVVAGDMDQTDLPHKDGNPLLHAWTRLSDPDISKVRLTEDDIMRHGLVRQILKQW